MQLANAPSKLTVAFASAGNKNTIPVPSQQGTTPGAASWTDGFPPATMMPLLEGGVPPSGLDFNGVLYALSQIAIWFNTGAGFPFDSGFAQAIGGYPKGARVLRGDGSGYWFSTVDGNTTNPDSPQSEGWSTGQIMPGQNPVSSVYAAAQQTLDVGNSKILLDSVEFDAGLWDSANRRFVASTAGKYRMSGSVLLPAPGGQNLATQIWKNGVLAKQCFQAPQVSNVNLSLPFDAIVYLQQGDYLEPYLNVGQTAVQTGPGAAYVFAQVEYLGT